MHLQRRDALYSIPSGAATNVSPRIRRLTIRAKAPAARYPDGMAVRLVGDLTCISERVVAHEANGRDPHDAATPLAVISGQPGLAPSSTFQRGQAGVAGCSAIRITCWSKSQPVSRYSAS